MKRREFLQNALLTSGLGLFSVPCSAQTTSELLPLTAPQVLGPFYPLSDFNIETTTIPEEPPGFNLVSIRTETGVLPDAKGRILHFNGQVLNREGKAIAGAVVELWNTDTNGWYIDPDGAPNSSELLEKGRDVYFQGYGSLVTDERGVFSFRTIRPIPYPVGSIVRASHLHVIVRIGGAIVLTTQLYFQDELDSFLTNDPIHGLSLNLAEERSIAPNLIKTQETIDHDGNIVITGHQNLVIDQVSDRESFYKAELSNTRIDLKAKKVVMNITPGRKVDIYMSYDLKDWMKIAENQSSVYGEILPGLASEKAFFQARTVATRSDVA